MLPMSATAMKMAKKKHGIGEDKTYGGIIQDIKSSIQNINTKSMDEQIEPVIYKVPDYFVTEDVLEQLRKEKREIKTSKGSFKIEANTSAAVLGVHKLLNSENQEKVKRMLNYSPQSFRTVVNFAFGVK